jgi:hypothetical protein
MRLREMRAPSIALSAAAPLLGCAALLASASALAQAADPNPMVDLPVTGEAAEIVASGGSDVQTSEGPADRSGYGPKRPKIELQTDEGGTTANFTIAADQSDVSDRPDSAGFFTVTQQKFSFHAAVPVTKEDTETPFTFGDLGNFETVEFGYTIFVSKVGQGPKAGADRARFRRFSDDAVLKCAAIYADKFVASTDSDGARRRADDYLFLLRTFQPDSARDSVLGEEIATAAPGDGGMGKETNPFPSFADVHSSVKSNCTTKDPIAFMAKYIGKAEAREFRRAFLSTKPIYFAGLNGAAGQSDLKFIDPVAFAERSQKKTAISGSAYAGLIGANYDWALRAKYSYISQFESAMDGQICRNSVVNPAMPECLSGPQGAPGRVKSSIATIELRKQFNPGDEATFAIAPQFVYDFDKKDFAVDIPIYLTRSKEGTLNGGIRFGYRSDSKDLGAGIFIGLPFDQLFGS